MSESRERQPPRRANLFFLLLRLDDGFEDAINCHVARRFESEFFGVRSRADVDLLARHAPAAFVSFPVGFEDEVSQPGIDAVSPPIRTLCRLHGDRPLPLPFFDETRHGSHGFPESVRGLPEFFAVGFAIAGFLETLEDLQFESGVVGQLRRKSGRLLRRIGFGRSVFSLQGSRHVELSPCLQKRLR